MKDNVVVVVGDAYGAFTRHASVVTLSSYLRGEAGHDGERVLIGQGMSHSAAEGLADEAAAVARRDELASLRDTHKRSPANVMITAPRRIEPARYTVQLALNDADDRLLDHVHGSHLSGMVFVEAGRQAVIACCEVDQALASRPEPWGFVWTGLRVEFTRFAFPVPTELRLELVELPGSTPAKPTYTARVEVWQASRTICVMGLDYGLLPERTIAAIEARAGAQTVEALRAEHVTAPATAAAPEAVATQPAV